MRPSKNPALSAWIRLLKAYNLIVKQSRSRLAEHCTLAQFDILAQLSRANDGTTPAELSRKLLVTAGNVTGMIDRMQEAGLVQRKDDLKDRRIIRVHLTSRGRNLAKAVIPEHANDIRRMFSGMKENEIRELGKLLDKLIGGLEQ
jgi:DNA-binding MarR family transcriptional regulator